MRGAACLQPHPRRRQLCEHPQQLAAPDLPAQHRLLGLVNTVKLKDMLGSINPNPDNRHRTAPSAALSQLHSLAQSMPSGAVHPNMNTVLSDLLAALTLAFRRPCAWVPGSSLRDAPE
jgi:hypothetical protein